MYFFFGKKLELTIIPTKIKTNYGTKVRCRKGEVIKKLPNQHYGEGVEFAVAQGSVMYCSSSSSLMFTSSLLMGMLSMVNRVQYIINPLSSFLYSIGTSIGTS